MNRRRNVLKRHDIIKAVRAKADSMRLGAAVEEAQLELPICGRIENCGFIEANEHQPVLGKTLLINR
ncbi:MAG TPA: hypothetical protein VG778_00115 [Blastocatellia bacterium]|nr:hypothetical protein [Blastocatellia bacterium]